MTQWPWDFWNQSLGWMGKDRQARSGPPRHDLQGPLQFNHPVICPHKHSHTHCTSAPFDLSSRRFSLGVGLLTGGCVHIFAIIITTGFQFMPGLS